MENSVNIKAVAIATGIRNTNAFQLSYSDIRSLFHEGCKISWSHTIFT